MGYCELGMVWIKLFAYSHSWQCAGTTYNFKNFRFLNQFYRLLVAQETSWVYLGLVNIQNIEVQYIDHIILWYY